MKLPADTILALYTEFLAGKSARGAARAASICRDTASEYFTEFEQALGITRASAPPEDFIHSLYMCFVQGKSIAQTMAVARVSMKTVCNYFGEFRSVLGTPTCQCGRPANHHANCVYKTPQRINLTQRKPSDHNLGTIFRTGWDLRGLPEDRCTVKGCVFPRMVGNGECAYHRYMFHGFNASLLGDTEIVTPYADDEFGEPVLSLRPAGELRFTRMEDERMLYKCEWPMLNPRHEFADIRINAGRLEIWV